MTAYQQTAASPVAGTAAPASPFVDAVPVLIKRLDQGLPLPARAHPGDAGVDLCTAVDVVLGPGERALVPTGMAYIRRSSQLNARASRYGFHTMKRMKRCTQAPISMPSTCDV